VHFHPTITMAIGLVNGAMRQIWVRLVAPGAAKVPLTGSHQL
jgi:hypothetical protein